MLNERDSMLDVLIQEKDLTKVYGAFLTETTNPELRKLLEKNLVESAKDQYKIFEAMMKNRYYLPKVAEEEDIEEQKKSFSSVKAALKAQ